MSVIRFRRKINWHDLNSAAGLARLYGSNWCVYERTRDKAGPVYGVCLKADVGEEILRTVGNRKIVEHIPKESVVYETI